ncbi:hypothetical protein EDB89DRAFT_273534 [Lactarius sanguifluus]|nr:hypothetical protein EDB89DRAFT_273534 [Lactarius sanguifluus]
MRASPLAKWEEPDAVLRNSITSPYMSPLFLFVVCWLNSTAQAAQIDMIIGSIANGINSSGGFCAGSRIVLDHQRINGTSFVFSAAVPALLAVSASERMNILRNMPPILSTLQENVRAIRAEAITMPPPRSSHPPAFFRTCRICVCEAIEPRDPSAA